MPGWPCQATHNSCGRICVCCLVSLQASRSLSGLFWIPLGLMDWNTFQLAPDRLWLGRRVNVCADGLLCPPLPCSPEAVSPTEPGVCSLARQRVSKYWRSSCLLSSSPAGKLEACAATLRFSIGAGSALRSPRMHSEHSYHCPAPRSRTVTSRQRSRETGYKHGPIGKWGCVENTAYPGLKFQIADKTVTSGCPSGCSLWLKRWRKCLHDFPALTSHPLIMSSTFQIKD